MEPASGFCSKGAGVSPASPHHSLSFVLWGKLGIYIVEPLRGSTHSTTHPTALHTLPTSTCDGGEMQPTSGLCVFWWAAHPSFTTSLTFVRAVGEARVIHSGTPSGFYPPHPHVMVVKWNPHLQLMRGSRWWGWGVSPASPHHSLSFVLWGKLGIYIVEPVQAADRGSSLPPTQTTHHSQRPHTPHSLTTRIPPSLVPCISTCGIEVRKNPTGSVEKSVSLWGGGVSDQTSTILEMLFRCISVCQPDTM